MRTTSPLLALALALAACGGADRPPTETPAPKTSTAPAPKAPQDKDEGAKKAAAIEKLTADEAKVDACNPEHKEALEKLLAEIESGMKAKTSDDGKPLGLQMVTRKVLPLGSSARGVELSVSGKGTELHVMAYGVHELSLDVLQGTTAATTVRSPFQHAPAASSLELKLAKIGSPTQLESDSRQVQLKAGQGVQVKLTGQGCAALVAFLKP